jgi:HSP20 family protein
MAVIRFEPFRDPLERLLSMAATGTRAPLGMPMDVYRAGDGSYHVEADLPGADPDSVEVTVEHSTLTIRAERTPHYSDSDQVIVTERPQGSFTRQLSLGEGVDSENLTADYADGVLHVTIPVSPKTQARRVEITHASGGKRTISGSTAEKGEAPAGSGGG